MKLTQTKDYLLFVDEKAEIKEGDKWIYDKNSPSIIPLLGNTNIVKEGISKGLFNKIIAYRKLNKEAKELDLPELPPFEVDIEIMWSDFNKNHNRNCPLGKEQFVRAINYKAAQSKQFSLDDVKKALSEAFKASQEGYQITADEIIQSLSTQQLPKEFIISDMEYLSADGSWKNVRLPLLDDFARTANLRYKTITNSEGKQEIQGKYIW